MLFCQGIPGAGKTILTSMAIDQLTTTFQDDMDTGIAYIYFDYRQKEETAERLLRNLLKQLAQKRSSLPTCVSAMYKQDTDQGIPPSLEAISLALQTVARDYSKTFIIIDANDECTNSNDCQVKFLEEILNLCNKSAANIFATSRPNTEIANRFKGATFIEICARGEDIRQYLNGNMDHLLSDSVRNDMELRTEIEKAIVSSVQGMFLLAKLHLNSLAGKFTIKDIRNTLEKLSVGSEAYDDAYKGMMRRFDSQNQQRRELARRALSWIVYAKRPLSTTELQQALAVEHWHHELDDRNFTSIEDIVSVCAGLVTIVRQSDQPSGQQSSIVRLVHYTAQDYFERTQAEWFPNAESEITNSCITYLSFSVFDSGFCTTDTDFEERLASNPFYNYSARNWGYHARNITPLPQQAMAFIGCDAKVQASGQVLMAHKPTWKDSNYSQQFPKKMIGQHLAAYFGIRELFENTLDDQSLDADDGHGRTPLSYATSNGH
ncbi:hypothetical protein THARTR1_01758 [Trichoderma harzianum]|uniref:NACHT domain-containing protein n=1 Tax=Trichoderma harzianum TaxID=5544 RepID=A0A2K0ULV5_TRIHA|nr:hypothetical protein THARTR1_01758 [Trichoderma harzianum]